MNEAACIVYVVAFLALPPAMLMTRLLDKARMPWGLLLAMSVAVGWLLVNLAHRFHVNGLLVQAQITGDGMRAMSSFPKNSFLSDFGWLLGPAYLVPWLLLYWVFVFMRWLLTGSSASFRRH